MKARLKDIYHSFPVQLVILHFRKYQVLLFFWALLFSIIRGGFMKSFGMDGLFFSPEYLNDVNALSTGVVGVCYGMFVMAWNVTTFILHSKRCRFLATTGRPFLKYTINNAVIPLLFLIYYMIRMAATNSYRELMPAGEITWLVLGFLGGFCFMLIFSFVYFFGAEKTILKSVAPLIANPQKFKEQYYPANRPQTDKFGLQISYYFSTGFRLRKARSVSHYSQNFLDLIFKRHHFAAIISIILAFLFLSAVGMFLENKFFQLPPAACILILFAVLTAVIGALTYFLKSWSLLFAIVLVIVFNILFETEVLDPRNKAYGLDYSKKELRPTYDKQSLNQLCTPDKIEADRANMISILENWKRKQNTAKPIMVFVNVSGGGLRSATFTMNTLQRVDSISKGAFMKQTFMINGASGGMLAATYFRELYRSHINGNQINLYNPAHIDHIAEDLLNPVSTSLIARDIFAPVQKFTYNGHTYTKDRGYAFEQKLRANTSGVLDKKLSDFFADEKAAKVPMILFNTTITRDGRKMMIGSQPLSFMMKPVSDSAASPDAVDFAAFFHKQGPENLRLLTILRMNATFPYILPNVWMPCNPVVDVMDAGIRDNIGQETTLRFIENFKDWIKANTGGVVILQLRDRVNDNWQQPFEGGGLTDVITKPATMLQHNWQKLQDFYHNGQFNYAGDSLIKRIQFMYSPEKEDKAAALNFHLTAREKRDVISSFNNAANQKSLAALLASLQ